MTVRCKFEVVGVENTSHRIWKNFYKEDTAPEVYGHILAEEHMDWTPSWKGRLDRSYKHAPTDHYIQNIRLAAVYDPSGSDVSFSSATPTGELKFMLNNPEVAGFFKPGDAFYITLERAEK
jgi:hypothetical protein